MAKPVGRFSRLNDDKKHTTVDHIGNPNIALNQTGLDLNSGDTDLTEKSLQPH